MFQRRPDPVSQQGHTSETLIFLHVAKTAGFTVRTILDRECGAGAVLTLDQFFAVRDGARHPEIARFLERPPEERAAVRVIVGHMEFGLHEALGQRATYATVLRHPVDRLMSHYYFVRSKADHYLHQAVVGGNVGLLDYVGVAPGELDNGQVRMLSAQFYLRQGELTRAHLQAAKDNLVNHVAVVGVQDDLATFLAVLQRTLQLPNVHTEPKNITPGRPPLRSLSRDDYRRLLAQQELDLELYEFARGLANARAKSLGLLTADPRGPAGAVGRAVRALGRRLRGALRRAG